jgi:sugar O-acyltransferase (sialic acid O-acetyltransferase NeuD family)
MFARAAETAAVQPWTLTGFIDDRPDALAGHGLDAPVGPMAAAGQNDKDVFVVAIGDPAVRLGVVRTLSDRGVRFASIIHPTALIGDRSELGPGAILAPFSLISCDAVVGAHVLLNTRASVGHDVEIGQGCTFSGYAEANGGVRLGEGVFLGSHTVIVPGITVGAFASTMAGSIVVRDAVAGSKLGGNPARVLALPAS